MYFQFSNIFNQVLKLKLAWEDLNNFIKKNLILSDVTALIIIQALKTVKLNSSINLVLFPLSSLMFSYIFMCKKKAFKVIFAVLPLHSYFCTALARMKTFLLTNLVFIFMQTSTFMIFFMIFDLNQITLK